MAPALVWTLSSSRYLFRDAWTVETCLGFVNIMFDESLDVYGARNSTINRRPNQGAVQVNSHVITSTEDGSIKPNPLDNLEDCITKGTILHLGRCRNQTPSVCVPSSHFGVAVQNGSMRNPHPPPVLDDTHDMPRLQGTAAMRTAALLS